MLAFAPAEICGLSQTGIAMTASVTSTIPTFDPPGPGSWEQDPVHFPRPMTRYFQEIHPPSFKRGTNDFARFYGLLIDGLQIGYVNGFGYNQVLPAPDAEIPQRFARAEQVFTHKLWREQLHDWDANCKPAAVAKHRELQAVDPDALSDVELVAYLTRYLDLVGHRLIDGFDIAEPTALELPDALLRAIRIAVSGEARAASDVDARVAEIRGQVPAAHQDQFDELLGEARLTYRLRDERGVYSDISGAGLMRRAAPAASRPITKRGRLADPHQMLDAGLDEMCALV